MIVLMHGSGDDDTKAEMWMGWFAKVCRMYGETVLVVPGVGTKDSEFLLERIKETFAGLPKGDPQGTRGISRVADKSLKSALEKAEKEIGAIIKGYNCKNEKELIKGFFESADYKKRVKDTKNAGASIKLRAASAALTVLAYYRKSIHREPIRIIGHSRGGSAALAMHNILTYYSIPCNHTLLLDPVHGGRKMFGHKEYYRLVWGGMVSVVTAPRSNFMANVEIKEAKTGAGTVIPFGKTKSVKHGHMGKFRAYPDAQKESGRAEIKKRLEGLTRARNPGVPVAGQGPPRAIAAETRAGMREHLIALFNATMFPKSVDKKLIATLVINTVSGSPADTKIW